MNKTNQFKYILATILAGVLWGTISIFLKGLNAIGLTSITVVMVRAIVSSLIMVFVFLIKDKSLFKINLKDIWMFVGTGVFSLSFFSLCYFRTIIECGVGVAVILLYTSPIFILILSMILFKEKLNRRKVIALVATFVGCVLISGFTRTIGSTTGDVVGNATGTVGSSVGSAISSAGQMKATSSQINAKGFIIGLMSGLGYGLYSIFSRFALKKYKPLTVIFYTFLFSGLSLLPFCNVVQVAKSVNLNSIFYILGISVFCTVLPYLFYTYGLSGLETAKAAIIVTVEPLVGSIVGVAFFGETITVVNFVGIVLILGSVVLLGLPEKKSRCDV